MLDQKGAIGMPGIRKVIANALGGMYTKFDVYGTELGRLNPPRISEIRAGEDLLLPLISRAVDAYRGK
ncbi:hypothetical protein ABW20_dc0104048 [Dactylellina cionopaga]|nr:hypothetical protein ABW20_dc0104048 [Dactylellina cionopaga]